MKYLIIFAALGAVFGAGWCGASISSAVAKVERAAAVRDATEAARAGKRQAWRDGSLFKNETTVRKSPVMDRVLRSTRAMRLPAGFSLVGE